MWCSPPPPLKRAQLFEVGPWTASLQPEVEVRWHKCCQLLGLSHCRFASHLSAGGSPLPVAGTGTALGEGQPEGVGRGDREGRECKRKSLPNLLCHSISDFEGQGKWVLSKVPGNARCIVTS